MLELSMHQAERISVHYEHDLGYILFFLTTCGSLSRQLLLALGIQHLSEHPSTTNNPCSRRHAAHPKACANLMGEVAKHLLTSALYLFSVVDSELSGGLWSATSGLSVSEDAFVEMLE